ncbi:hypothetical protein Hanom_Chr09g00837421 [Helianthus anomalus]
MEMVFDEQENNKLESFNNWYMRTVDTNYRNVSTDIWVKSFEHFMCQKDETLNELEIRFKVLMDNLRNKGIRISNDEQISKLTNALPAKWDEFLVELKKKDFFQELYPKQFFNEVNAEFRKECMKRKEFLNEMEKNLQKLELDVLTEINKRICVCLVTKSSLKYDIKRTCYIDESINSFDFVKLFCAVTYKMETKDIPKNEEFVKNEKVCFKCNDFKTDNDKLLKNAESLTLEIKKLNDEKQTDYKQILMLKENCENLKIENDKLLAGLNSLTSENKGLKEHVKGFESKKKSSEDENFWIKLENKNLKANEAKFQEQIKILENEKSVLENMKNENENSIKSHLVRISQLENESENSRSKIDVLEKKLKGFVTSSELLNILFQNRSILFQ